MESVEGTTYIFATHNPGKLKEIREIFAERGIAVYSPEDANIDFDPKETGQTFMNNAIEKARNCAAVCDKNAIIISDDSGLCIDALDGEPGVDSALWLGESTPYSEKNNHILTLLKDVPEEKRTARFVCVIAAILPGGKVLTTEAAVEGRIAYAAQGKGGFGYDPVFYLPEWGKTSAQLSSGEKNRISHRGKALRLMLDKLV